MSAKRANLFIRLPIERSLKWESQSFFLRMLGTALYAEFQEREVVVGRDWKRAVCVRLGVPGNERANVHTGLQRLMQEGLVVVAEGRFRLCYTDASVAASEPAQPAVHSTSTQGPLGVHSGSTQGPLKVHSGSTQGPLGVHSQINPRNHSGHAGEIDRKIDRERERNAGAREGLDQDGAVSLVRVRFADRFHEAEGSLWTRSGDPALSRIAAWLLSLPGDPEANLARTLDGFFADPWVCSKHFPIDHLARYPQKYFEPRPEPVAPAQPLVPVSQRRTAPEGV